MLRVITPKGALRQVAKVTPVCEMRNKFNKKVVRTVEFANGMSANPNAVQIEFPNETLPLMNTLFIGNLSTVAVKDIMQKMLEQGYFDFSSLEYQEEMNLYKTIFDGGKSNPYTSDYTFGLVCVHGDAGVFGGMSQDEFSCAGDDLSDDDMDTEDWDESEDGDDEE